MFMFVIVVVFVFIYSDANQKSNLVCIQMSLKRFVSAINWFFFVLYFFRNFSPIYCWKGKKKVCDQFRWLEFAITRSHVLSVNDATLPPLVGTFGDILWEMDICNSVFTGMNKNFHQTDQSKHLHEKCNDHLWFSITSI